MPDSTTYSISLQGIDQVTAAMAASPEIVREEMERFLAWAISHLTAEIQDRTPAAEGALRASIIGSYQVSDTGMLGVVGTSLDYAMPVELGTKPHAVSESGILAIARWAMRKLPLGQAVSAKTGRPLKTPGIEEAAQRVAHAIAWKIRHKGTAGAFMFDRAFSANRGLIERGWVSAVERITQRIGGKQ